MAEQQFKNLTIGGVLAGQKGILKLTPSLIFWKTESRNETIYPKDIAKAYWMCLQYRVYQLKLEYANKTSIKFDGFQEPDYDMLKQLLLDNYQIELDTINVSTKGDNHGAFEVTESALAFTIEGNHSFEIPLSEVAGTKMTAVNKNDVVVEFNPDATLDEEDEQVMEIRFFLPNVKDKDAKDDDDKHNPTTAQLLNDIIKQKTAINNVTGTNFCRFPSVHLLTPRGRYDIELFPAFMKLHGKTHDYKIRYEQIVRLFQLPKSDKDVFFILSLDPAIRQGGTKYPHLVLQFERAQKTTMNIAIPPELQDKFKELPTEFDNEETHLVVNKIFNGVTTHKVTTPSNFKSHSGASAIRCSYKTYDGYLYPLSKSFFFIPKPTQYMRFSEISHVEFARAGNAQSNRTFDFIITLKDGESHSFVSMQKSEYEHLFDFITTKKIKIENQEEEGTKMPFADDSDESEDEDFEEKSEDEEEEADEDFKSGDEAGPEEEEEVAEEEEEEDEKPKKKKKDDEEKPKKKKKKDDEKPKKKKDKEKSAEGKKDKGKEKVDGKRKSSDHADGDKKKKKTKSEESD